MKKVEVTYDTKHGTWNVMLGTQCLYYTKDVQGIDVWLASKEGQYYEG